MNLRQVADLSVARLGMPIPMAKLVTMQAIGQALVNSEMTQVFAEALADWTSTRELESQCLEALCPLLVAAPAPEVVGRIRKAIGRPSIASNALLSIATGTPNVIASWTGCHSGPAPRYEDLSDELQELRAGTFVPPLFGNQLQKLEKRAKRPFLKQWSFEYRLLGSRFGRNGDGYVDYFRGADRETGGQFIARRAHLARSAFLRTLAYAVDHWDMPTSVASSVAEFAHPAEAIFLRFPPQHAPEWADHVQSHCPEQTQDAPAFAKTLIDAIEAGANGRLMHCSLTVIDEPKVRTDFEVFAIAQADRELDVDDVFRFHGNLLGEVSPDRDGLRAFVSQDLGFNGDIGIGFAPLMLPLLGDRIGYLQTDLLGRMPYVPAASRGLPDLELVPADGRAIFRSAGQQVGSWGWWCRHWQPTHLREQPPLTASCTSFTHDAARALVSHLSGDIEHVWRITTWTRENDYGEWAESRACGRSNES